MVLYKHGFFIKSEDPAFDKTHSPGEQVPHSGIYRCTGCGREIASNATNGDRFPPQNHHQHNPGQGNILWQLVAATQS